MKINVSIIPPSSELKRNRLFNPTFYRDMSLYFFSIFHKTLGNEYNIKTYDCNLFSKIDVLIIYNLTLKNYLIALIFKIFFKDMKIIYLIFEVESINKLHAYSVLRKLNADKIFTWYHSKKIPKQICIKLPNDPPFYKISITKKFEFCHIGTCFQDINDKTIYEYRINIIKEFSKKINDFHIYGRNWDLVGLNGNKCEDKFNTLAKYRFTIIVENSRINNYVSEKIFDALLCGTIPIYFGAPNINNIIPQNIFVDISKFKSIEKLLDYVTNMSEREIKIYQKNITKFINSKAYKDYSSKKLTLKVRQEMKNLFVHRPTNLINHILNLYNSIKFLLCIIKKR